MSDKNKADLMLVVGSKVKDIVKEQGCQSSGELVQEVSNRVYNLVVDACKRAQENDRKTVRTYDL